MLSQPRFPDDLAPRTGQECRKILADALRQLATGVLGEPVHVQWGEPDRPCWVPTQRSFAWVVPVDVTFATDTAESTARVEWPALWSATDIVPVPVMSDKDPVSPGAHAGYYVGRPLTASWGLRLRPGLHFIPRPFSRGWKVDVVVAPLLGREVFGTVDEQRFGAAVTGLAAGGYWGPTLVTEMLDSLGLPTDTLDRTVVVDALLARLSSIEDHPESQPRRTAAARNRFYGGDEIFAELLLGKTGRPPGRSMRSAGASALLRDVAARVEQAGAMALKAFGSGSGGTGVVVSPTGVGTTMARVEESGRASFVGYRGLGRVRGRADLRDLEAGWRGVLCPVQTPESLEVGLVRYTTAGVRPDAPQELSEWFDLSASAALIPFVNHDDPARASIGSKNLKQAVPVMACEPPLVATGWERVLGSNEGVVHAPERGEVTSITADCVTIANQRGQTQVAFGAPWQVRSGIENAWLLAVTVGDRVQPGQVLAHAPDVRLSDGQTRAELCLGVNALVALTPWHGLNYEDGIVVSESFAERMTSTHVLRFDEAMAATDSVTWLVESAPAVPSTVERGETLLAIQGFDGRTTQVSSPVAGELLGAFIDRNRGTVAVLLRVRRRLAVGDKLTNRHQGKGVVSVVLPDSEMPRLPDGRPIEVILNPVGILRRLNVGQMWEMHTGLAAMLGDGQQVRVGRRVTDPDELAATLVSLGAPRGRMPLTLPNGSTLGGPEGVVVGPQYIIKLNHMAADKLSMRGHDRAVSPVSGQPTQLRRFRHDSWVGAAQRMGEMEVWALEAAGANEVLADALQVRSAPRDWAKGKPRASLRSVQAHLGVLGLELRVGDGPARPLQEISRQEVTALTPAWRLADFDEPVLADLPELPRWRELGDWERQQPELDLSALLAALDDEGPLRLAGHPLYDPELFGQPGSVEAEQLRFAIPLPHPMRHPWTSADAPVWLNSVPVLPVAYRWPSAESAQGLDRGYRELAIRLVEYEKLASKGQDDDATRMWRAAMRGVVAILGTRRESPVGSVTAALAGKRGLLRRFLLGQSVTCSGRSVIVPDLDLRPDQVGLPRQLACRIGVDETEPLGDVVVINRQPSLHPYNMVAQHAVVVGDDAIHLHPIVLGGLAGDFDGDTVAVHRPTSHQARADALRRLAPASTVRSSACGAVLAKMDLDIALGLYLASDPDHPSYPKVAGLAGDGNRLDSVTLPAAVDSMVSAAPDPDTAVALLADLERTGLEASTGWSVGALDLLADAPDSQLADAKAAGAAGGDRAVLQLRVRRGSVAGGHPHTPIVDVDGCFLTGLTNEDFFGTAPGALASLAEKKLTSPHAGALTKTLVEVADQVIVSEARCGGLPDDLRSPLTCTSTTGICQACYGTDPGTGQPPEFGRRVGVLAAMLVGERSTQLSMKVFHAGGESGALDSTLGQLKAVFGQGRSASAFGTTTDGRPRNLRGYLDSQGDLANPSVRLAALQPVVDYGGRLLGRVGRVHVAVILRQLVDTYLDSNLREAAPKGNQSLISCAQRRGRSMFEVATARGKVDWLMPGRAAPAGGVRTRLTAGAPS